MALLSGTASKFALDLLRSGKAFEPNGVKLFKSGYRATQGTSAPEEVVSEFQRLVKSLEGEAVQRRIKHSRIPYSEEKAAKLGLMRGAPWSDIRMTERYIPKSVNYWIDFLPGQANYDLRAADEFRRAAERADSTAVLSGGKHRTVRRDEAVENRTNAAIIEALVNLFGGAQ